MFSSFLAFGVCVHIAARGAHVPRCAGSGSALRANPITTVPRDLFFVIRTVQLLRGLAHAALGPGGLDVEAAWLRFAEVAAAEAAG